MTDLAQASHDRLEAWLTDRVAFYLDRATDDIDPHNDLARYGLDSVYAMSVVSDIEDHLQIEVDVAQVRQHPTIASLTDYLLGLPT